MLAAARTVMRLARTGAVRPALRTPVRSTLAANCWVAMAADMVLVMVCGSTRVCRMVTGARPGRAFAQSRGKSEVS